MAQAPEAIAESPPSVTLDLELSPPTTPKRRWRGWWIAIGLGSTVLLLAIGYGASGFLSASASVDAASSAIGSTLDHQKSVVAVLDADPFKDINFNTDAPDTAAARQALAGFEPKLAPALAQDRADRTALLTARARLSGSFLTLAEQGMLGDARKRVDAALAGLAAADQQLAWRQQQANFIHPYLDVIDGWVAMHKAAAANDLVGAVAQLQLITTNQQRAASYARPPAIPPQTVAGLSTLQKEIADIRGLFNAVQASDESGFAKYEAAVTADAAILSRYDAAAAEHDEQAGFDRLTAKYNQEMQLAAGN